MLSCNPRHKFDNQKLNNFNNIIFFPKFCFNINKASATLKDRIIIAQKSNLFSQEKFLEIEIKSTSFKSGHFMSIDNVFYYKNLLWVPTE